MLAGMEHHDLTYLLYPQVPQHNSASPPKGIVAKVDLQLVLQEDDIFETEQHLYRHTF